MKLVSFALFAWVASAGAGCKRITAWTADHRDGNVNVWVYGPTTVAPGDTLALEVETTSGYRSGISAVYVDVGRTQDTVRGDGMTWGSTVSSRESNADSVAVELRIPPDAPPGALPVSLIVDYVSASARGSRGFANVDRFAAFDFTLEVASPAARTMSRVLLIGRGVATLLVLVVLAYVVAYRRGRRKVSRARGGGVDVDENLAAGVVLIAMVGIGYLGHWAFALPTARGLMTSSAYVRYALLALWFVLPVLAIVRGYGRGKAARDVVRGFEARLRAVLGRPSSPYRTATTGEPLDQRAAPVVTLARLHSELARDGLAGKLRRRALHVETKGGAVRISTAFPEQVTPELLVLSSSHLGALDDVARRLIPALGPVVIEVNGNAASRALLDG